MRIISGKYGGRVFQPPANMPFTRPTTDLAKGGLFNIIENNLQIASLSTLDLFGGTGSISYELASRGAINLTVVEKDPQMADFIQKTSAKLGIQSLNVVRMDVFKFIEYATSQYDFIFAGPPYALTNIDDLPLKVFEKGLLKENGWFVLEHTPRNQYTSHLFFRAERNYGTTVFSIFVNKPKA